MRGRGALTVIAGLALSAESGISQGSAAAKRDSAGATALPAVEITVTRGPRGAPITAPYAISVARRSTIDTRGQLQDVIGGVPGLVVANRNNPTQDPRIVIRGVGARTAFGVRGVRVLHDGIPLTVADGQTPLDYLDVESVDRIEVIRGSASSLYGNSAGGVVAFSSPALEQRSTAAAVLAGSHGFLRSGVRRTGGAGALEYSASLNHTTDDGYRAHARQRVTRANARARRKSGESSITAHLLALHMPLAENPGALTATQLATDRRMAEPLAVTRAAGKRVSQVQAGLTYARDLSYGDLSAILFAGRRALDNPLTFAVIDLERASGGLLVRASTRAWEAARFTIGADLQHQDDDREEFENCTGATATGARCPSLPAQRGSLRRSQRERVTSVGPYAAAEVRAGRYRLSAGLRADAISFDVRDRLVSVTDPDESGRRSMRAVSPHVAVLARLDGANSVYANVSSAFETPTATELGNKPDGSAGINTSLEPQRSRSVEIGAKGAFSAVTYDFAAYATGVRDELVPFEIPGGAGRRYFRNAGRTRRRGVELALGGSVGRLELRSAASYSDFRFSEFETATADFSGKTIPGVPGRFAEVSAAWNGGVFQLGAFGRFSSSVIVDDANGSRAPGYEVLSLRARGTVRMGSVSWAPGLAVENVFGRKYVGAVSVNAAGGRFYEPAPGRALVGSLAASF